MNLLATLCTIQCARVVGSSVRRIHQARRDCACLCVKTQTFTAIYRADKATNHFIALSVLLSPSMLHILDEIDFILFLRSQNRACIIGDVQHEHNIIFSLLWWCFIIMKAQKFFQCGKFRAGTIQRHYLALTCQHSHLYNSPLLSIMTNWCMQAPKNMLIISRKLIILHHTVAIFNIKLKFTYFMGVARFYQHQSLFN
uniref:Uncharacterized protein n=1 Tax=Rhipicephalus microplus TaxID=6941 RepID=A0A6G5A3U3_RHIMP